MSCGFRNYAEYYDDTYASIESSPWAHIIKTEKYWRYRGVDSYVDQPSAEYLC